MIDPILVNSLDALEQRLAMQDFAGEFETHLTVSLLQPEQFSAFARWCEERGLKYVHIVLDKGVTASQPMLTYHSKGTFSAEVRHAYELSDECEKAGFPCCRVKLEVATNAVCVPPHVNAAQSQPPGRYFEHHVKVLISPGVDLEPIIKVARNYGAHFSSNARRIRNDGMQERFITQRCYHDGLLESQHRLDSLLQMLQWRDLPVLETEAEYVVFDSNISLDKGWIPEEQISLEYGPPATSAVFDWMGQPERPRVFEPALKKHVSAFSQGEAPATTISERLEHEYLRAEVRNHLLRLMAGSRWHENLVLRGSTLLRAWFGAQAREPKDIDWVFQPAEVKIGSSMCEECFEEIVALVKGHPHSLNAQILVDKIASDEIWAYERADGRRLNFPYKSAGAAQREIQVDIVWGEKLLMPPVLTELPMPEGDELSVWAATPELSLAWKIAWLVTDKYPQGKDLYDAALLAENNSLPRWLLNSVFEANYHTSPQNIEDLVKWTSCDWHNFKLDYPWIEGTEHQWRERLMNALAPTFQ